MKKIRNITVIIICLVTVLSLAPAVYADQLETGIYNFVNAESGKYLNVYAGQDRDGANVVVWTQDGSREQNFKIVDRGGNCYVLYPQSSSSRVVDINRGNSYRNPLRAGLRADIWTANDKPAQEFYIDHRGNSNYTIELVALRGYVLQADEPWKNNGSVTLQKYNESAKQLWKLVRVDNSNSVVNSSTNSASFSPEWPAPSAYNITVLSYYYGNAPKGIHYKKGAGSILGSMDIGGAGDVVATEAGTVIEVVKGYGNGWGNNITIRHDNGQYSFYAHMKDDSLTVSANSRVSKGQKIGVIGNTGNSFGNHLHFEIWDSQCIITETWIYFRDKCKSSIKYDADIVSGGSNPYAWREWIVTNCKLSAGMYVAR